VRTSETIDKLAAALAVAQGALQPAVKESTNPHFKSSYVDLHGVWKSCRDALSKNGLSVVQGGGDKGDGSTITYVCRIMHASGQWIESELTLRPAKNDPQGVGSAITYARRYLLASMVGVAPQDEDDDANAASAPTQRMVAPAPTPATRVGTGGVDPRNAFKATAAKWAGVKAEDAAAAARDLCRVLEINPDAMSADDWGKATGHVRKLMDEGKVFAEFVA
jgi:hypothetical protein